MIAGIRVAEAVFRAVDEKVDFEVGCTDGSRVSPGDHVAVIGGRARSLLAAERTALNFLQRLSGIATATAEAVRLAQGAGVRILDTRKTTPGLRRLEKYAVLMGGGVNHRRGLYDAYLIKENHITVAGGVGKAIEEARLHRAAQSGSAAVPITVEVRGLEELGEALEHRPDRVMLDNFSPRLAAQAVAMVGGRAEVEISGGVTLENLRAYAAARPDFISLGWLTHSAPALDLSMSIVS